MTDYHLGHVPGTVIVDKTELDALRAENQRAREGLQALQEVTGSHNDENPWLGVVSAVVLLTDALERLYKWDHLDSAADGPYWRREIDIALGRTKRA